MVSVGAEATTSQRPQVRRPLVAIGALAAITIAIDQATKWWALEALASPSRTIELFWTLRFRLLYNRGTAFSLTSDSGPVVSVIAVVVIAALIWSGRSQRSRGVIVSYGLIIGGTFGNLIDRAFRTADGDGFLRGGVVDFIDPQWFPVFNLADAALTIGIGLLILTGLILESPESTEQVEHPEHTDADPGADDGT